MDYAAQLRNLPRKHDFFIGFDSDGCVFDTMEIKHKECFCPAFIKHLGLQPVSKAGREVWEFVNLYSTKRGCNRFLALRHARDLLRKRADIAARGFTVPALRSLDEWTATETQLGIPALQQEVERTGNADLKRVMAWCIEVNERIRDLVFGMLPFPFVREVLAEGEKHADLIVVSQTPLEALEREWDENGMTGQIGLIAGQEHGTKAEHLALATGGKGYAPEQILMVGDAPGDHHAAQANNALFFPIIPGREEASWERLAREGLPNFFSGRFAGQYETRLIEEFNAALPEQPPWEEIGE